MLGEIAQGIWAGLAGASLLDRVNLALGIAGVVLMVRRSLWPASAQPRPSSFACSTQCEPVKAPSLGALCTSCSATPTSGRSAARTPSACSAEGATTTSAAAGSSPMPFSSATCACATAFVAAAWREGARGGE